MSDKPKKPQKLKARLPRGLEDRGPAAIAATREMVEKIRAVYERYGFEPVETPTFEYTDALGKFLPDQDRPNEGVFSFQDDDEQWISLRYDLTAPLARYVGERYGTDGLVLPYRSYRSGYVFRNEKPGPGRFRQFMQFDADTVGSASPAADAEMCMMAADTMEALGIARGDYAVKVNSRKLLDGALESIGLGGDDNAGRRLTVLRALDKYDRLGDRGVRELLGPGRKDESGDFTKGAGLIEEDITQIMGLFELTPQSESDFDHLSDWEKQESSYVEVNFDQRRGHLLREIHPDFAPGRLPINNLATIKLLRSWFGNSAKVSEGLDELEQIAQLGQAARYGSKRIRIDPSVVRGLEYYTGPVFEVELLTAIPNEKGQPVVFGSVGGGGRYDGLVSRFRGEPVPATGFSIGVSRLQAALTMLGKLDTKPAFGPVVVTVFDRDRVADYQKMVATLRNHGIRAELYLGNPKNMGNQLKYADRRNAPCVIIQGSDEKARGEVQIKDLIEGAKAAAAIASNQEWRESRPAQFSCKEDELVAGVRDVLARHDVSWG
ncbi:MAG: histidine--tRNA ligase [Bradyrhizobium sp.]